MNRKIPKDMISKDGLYVLSKDILDNKDNIKSVVRFYESDEDGPVCEYSDCQNMATVECGANIYFAMDLDEVKRGTSHPYKVEYLCAGCFQKLYPDIRVEAITNPKKSPGNICEEFYAAAKMSLENDLNWHVFNSKESLFTWMIFHLTNTPSCKFDVILFSNNEEFK